MSKILALQGLDAVVDGAAIPLSHISTDLHLLVAAPVEPAE
ncbi:hypothetical protein [Kitasatospora sp. NPDC093102]